MTEEILFYGFRQDGRRPGELRQIKIKLGVVDNSSGSALFQIGHTSVLAFIHGPKQTKHEKESGHIHCYFNTAYFSSSGERRKFSKGDKKSNEFEANVRTMFESVVLMENNPHSDIDIHVLVLADDGSVECAAINAITLSLIHAGVPLKDFLVSCSSGFYSGMPLIDLTYSESTSFQVISEYRVAVLGKSLQIAYLNYDDIGGHKLTPEVVREITAMAIEGCKQVHFIMKQELQNACSN
ncbi:unnamed protein product [Blepharisma stoltei]|uniref:Exoribonuclease phosphorolytic domain-containing protein n=1 Tax=Blepharisma stoltei TaxID=1481888 RepID=A0AAU9JRA3_9CILI|nr:unnamed protein product [Blepharisma stoltei]